MRDPLERLLRSANAPDPERAEGLWAEYRSGGPGSNAAFATLLAWYGGGLYRRVWGFVRSDAAEDVFQEVLVLLHRHRGKLPTFADALRWVRATADRRAVDAHRKATRRLAREAKAARPESTAADLAVREKVELQQSLAVALGRLTTEQRQAVALHYFEGLDKQAAAKVLGVHRDTLAKRLNEALAQLRKWLPMPVLLTTAAPTLSVERLAELAARACVASAGFGKPMAAVLITLTACGVAVGGWAAARPPPPAPQAARHTEPESVPDRNLRVFQAEVLPRQLAALKRIVLGNGEVELVNVEAFDTRLRCEYVLRHRIETAPGWLSRVRFVHSTAYRGSWAFLDLYSSGEWKSLDLKKPIILWRNPVSGFELLLPFPVWEGAMREFTRLPQDDRTETERQAHIAAVDRVAARYVGTWYRSGDPALRRDVRFADGKLNVTTETGEVTATTDIRDLIFDPEGRHEAVLLTGPSAIVSADGKRMTFSGSDEWWSRDPSR